MNRHAELTAAAAFTDELHSSLPGIAAALDRASADTTDRASAHEAYRLIHALKGAASMVGLAALSHLLNLAEDRLEAAQAAGVTPEALRPVAWSLDRFSRYMDTALAGESVEALATEIQTALEDTPSDGSATLSELLELEARELASWIPAASAPKSDPEPDVFELPIDFNPIASVPPSATEVDVPSPPVPAASTPPHPSVFDDGDLDLTPVEEISPELAEVFGEEAHEHLQTIARLTSQLSSAPDDRAGLQELRRAVHTLKGAAGVVGYKGASRLAHRMEDLLDRLYEGDAPVTPAVATSLAKGSDALDDLITGAADPAALHATVRRLFGDFDSLLAAIAPALVPAEVAQAALGEGADGSTVAPPAAALDGRPEIVGGPDGMPIRNRRRGGDRRHLVDRRGGSQALRVPFHRLNELLRAVSELVINRSTFEQHHTGLIEQVDELKLSTARLRRVAQKLEADYEARALAGGRALGGAASSSDGHGFDELEFDRYTEFHLLTRELAETANDIATITARVAETAGEFDSDLTRFGRLTREIQDKTMEFRMVPLGTLTTRLERAIRVTAEACGKRVDFAIEGEQVALDKSLLDEMADPLLHLLRNSVDHGIESPEARREAGKAERGRVVVRALHDGTDVVIEVQDDGRGLDLERIRRMAVSRGLVGEGDAALLAPDAVYAFVLEPGFSTADTISEISGRGVGMDVVRTKVARVGGRIQITSQPGAGATMTVRVPMTLAITRVLLVRAGGETFGLPLGAVAQIVRPYPTAIGRVGAERVLAVDGKTFPLRDLAEMLGLPRSTSAPAVPPVLIVNLAGRRIAVAVDEVMHSRDAVVKSLGTHLRKVHGMWGATLLGDGTVVLILNPADLAGVAEQPLIRHVAPVARASEREAHTILIVDDSLSMRHVLSTAVKKAGWNPLQARDGIEALEVLHRGAPRPDLVLLDVEMPRMDGFEFLSTVRSQGDYAQLPIVMLTSRGGEKHREKARALGATDYMVKPYHEDALIQNITRLITSSRAAGARMAS